MTLKQTISAILQDFGADFKKLLALFFLFGEKLNLHPISKVLKRNCFEWKQVIPRSLPSWITEVDVYTTHK